MKILSSFTFTHPHVVLNLYEFLCSVDDDRIFTIPFNSLSYIDTMFLIFLMMQCSWCTSHWWSYR